MSNKKIGSKLVDSLRHMRGDPPQNPAVMAPAPAAVQPAPAVAPYAAERMPATSYGTLHPRRIWPD